MSKKGDRQLTVMQTAIVRAGVRQGMKATLMIVSWAIAEVALERQIESMEEYSAWWKQGIATSYRELKAFRAAFPQFDRPGELLAAMNWRPEVGATRDEALSSLVVQPAP